MPTHLHISIANFVLQQQSHFVQTAKPKIFTDCIEKNLTTTVPENISEQKMWSPSDHFI